MVKIAEKTYEERLSDLKNRLLNFDEVLSFSSFSKFCESPMHFIRYKLDKKEDSAVMRRGSLVDVLLLTPDEYESKYYVTQGVWPTTDHQKRFCAKILSGIDVDTAYHSVYSKGSPDKTYESLKPYLDFKLGKTKKEPISQKEKDAADKMVAAVMGNDASRMILDEIGQAQKYVEWEFCGFKWRGFIDLSGDSVIADLKNWADAEPRKVGYTIRDRKFPLQISSYNLAEGMNKRCFAIVVDPQYNVSVTEIERQTQYTALEEIERRMAKFKTCIINDQWHMSYDFWVDGGIYKF